jgi:hypothetical protein
MLINFVLEMALSIMLGAIGVYFIVTGEVIDGCIILGLALNAWNTSPKYNLTIEKEEE